MFSLKPATSWKHDVSFASTRLCICRKDSVFLFCKCILCLFPCLILLGFSYCLLDSWILLAVYLKYIAAYCKNLFLHHLTFDIFVCGVFKSWLPHIFM